MSNTKTLAKLDHVETLNTNPLALKVPCRMMLVGQTGSGKTLSLIDILCTKKWMSWDVVLWCAPKSSWSQPKLKLLRKTYGEFVQFFEPEEGGGRMQEVIDQNHAKK